MAGQVLYALVAADCTFAVDLYVSRDDAEQALSDALHDVPAWVTLLSIVELPPPVEMTHLN